MINAKTSIIHTQDITTIKTLVCADINIPQVTTGGCAWLAAEETALYLAITNSFVLRTQS